MFPAFKEVFEKLDSNGGAMDGRRLFRNTGGGMQWCEAQAAAWCLAEPSLC